MPRPHPLIRLLMLLAVSALLTALPVRAQEPPDPTAQALAREINRVRVAQGLPALPLSRTLSRVAQAHMLDLDAHPRAPGCGLHSWSEQRSWTGCCYDARTHAEARCMWSKPRELSGGRYGGSGYELTYAGSEPATPAQIVAAWLADPAHGPLLLNQGSWARFSWQGMGVAVSGRHALLWLGAVKDPDGELPLPPAGPGAAAPAGAPPGAIPGGADKRAAGF